MWKLLNLEYIIPRFMEPGGSVPQLQGHSNNSYIGAESIQFFVLALLLSSHLLLGLPKGPFPVSLTVNILISLLSSSILAT